MKNGTTLLLTIASFTIFSLGLAMFVGKNFVRDKDANNGVFSGPILVVDPVAINTSIRVYLFKKRFKYGENGFV